jgi:hypothetical protein
VVAVAGERIRIDLGRVEKRVSRSTRAHAGAGSSGPPNDERIRIDLARVVAVAAAVWIKRP